MTVATGGDQPSTLHRRRLAGEHRGRHVSLRPRRCRRPRPLRRNPRPVPIAASASRSRAAIARPVRGIRPKGPASPSPPPSGSPPPSNGGVGPGGPGGTGDGPGGSVGPGGGTGASAGGTTTVDEHTSSARSQLLPGDVTVAVLATPPDGSSAPAGNGSGARTTRSIATVAPPSRPPTVQVTVRPPVAAHPGWLLDTKT